MTKMKTDTELRQAITHIVEKHQVGFVNFTYNIQGSIDIELDDGNNLFYEDRDALENEIRAIKGAPPINDIFIQGVPHT